MDNNFSGESGILIYQTEDGKTNVDVRLENETVWLSQMSMSQLFQTSKQNISLHLKNVYEEGELLEKATVKEYLTVQEEGNRRIQRKIRYYNLDAIISVGYRVRSHRGIQFRKWATALLREYLVKGFVLNDERLKEEPLSYPQFEDMVGRLKKK